MNAMRFWVVNCLSWFLRVEQSEYELDVSEFEPLNMEVCPQIETPRSQPCACTSQAATSGAAG